MTAAQMSAVAMVQKRPLVNMERGEDWWCAHMPLYSGSLPPTTHATDYLFYLLSANRPTD